MTISACTVVDGKEYPVGVVSPGQGMGSLSDEPIKGERTIYMFGTWEGREGVFKSPRGFDVEVHGGAFRHVVGFEGFEMLSDLAEPFEIQLRHVGRPTVTVRFRRVE